MADTTDTTTSTDQTNSNDTGDADTGQQSQTGDSSQQTADDLEALRAALKKANKEAETNRRRLKEIEDRDKTEAEKAAERAAEAERRAEQAEQALLRAKVAAKKGLPAELADRLQGADETEMAADADALLAAMKPRQTPGVPTGARDTGDAGVDMNALIRRASGRG